MNVLQTARPGLRQLAVVVVTAVLLVVLQAAGHGVLAPPEAWSVDGIRSWASRRGGAAAAMAGVRLIAIGLGWYVLALTLTGAISHMTRCRPLALLAERATPASVRRFLVGMAGAGTASVTLLAAPGATAAMAFSAPAPATPATDWSQDSGYAAGWPRLLAGQTSASDLDGDGRERSERGAAPGDSATGPGAAGEAPAGLAVLRRLPIDQAGAGTSEEAATGPGPTTAAAGRPAVLRLLPAVPADPVVSPAPMAPADRGTQPYVVEAGDSFWSIAADRLGEVTGTGTAPEDAAVARYWARLIDANRAILHDPYNPDLLFVGQALVLPPVDPLVG